MNYGYQDIKRVMAEASVSFEDADRALKKTHGNIDQAVIIALRKKKRRGGALESAVDAFVRLFFYRVRVEKGDKTFVDVALWILVAVFVFGAMFSYYVVGPICAVAAGIILLSGSRLTFEARPKKETEAEVVAVVPMKEDEVLQSYPDEEVAEEDGYNSVEV